MMKIGGFCFNWKVAAGLAAVGVGIWILKPALIVAALPLLILAACPLSMFFMMRGMGGMSGGPHAGQPGQENSAARFGLTRDEQLAVLKTQMATLGMQREAIVREVARLEATGAPAPGEAARAAARTPDPVRG